MLKKLASSFWISAVIIAFLSLFFFLGLFETWQDSLSDKLFVPRPTNPDIVIIAIDSPSINEIGRFPWSRKVYSDLLEKIGGHANSIGIDISFLEAESKDVDEKLAASFKKFGNITIAAEEENNNILSPIEVLKNEAKVGVVNTKPDSDGVTRKVVLKFDQKNEAFKHFAVAVTENYLFSRNQPASILDNPPLEEGKYFRINFAGAPDTFKEYSFVDVLNGKVESSAFDGKLVLVGATADDLHDTQLVPTSTGRGMAGVEILANTIQTLLDQKYLIPESRVQSFLTTAIIVFAITAVLVYSNILIGVIVIIITAVGYIIFGVLSFDAGIIRNLVFPSLAILTSGVGDIIYKYFAEYRQKRYIRKAFSYYLSEAVLSEVLSDPKNLVLGGKRKEITVLFSDVAGFTSISEKLNPESLAHALNYYLTEMTNIVFASNGVLDKYIGDAVMAFWGAPLKDPEHALNACKTAITMTEKLVDIRKEWEKLGVKAFGIRIGINTGEMVVGNMGSNMRFDYTLLGDNVNLGSRLEGINKEYGTQIIISENTYVQVKDKVIARKLDTVAVKGKSHGVVIYELRAIGTPTIVEKAFLNSFEEARHEYEKGNFKEALTHFEKFIDTYPDDNPAKVYIERCKALIKDRPEHWDGIYYATTK